MITDKKHEFIAGTTQSGKTHYAIEKGRRWKHGGVFFFNPQHIKAIGYTVANMDSEMSDIITLLKNGDKIAYMPNVDDEIAKQELKHIVSKLFKEHLGGRLQGKNTLLIADESHIYVKNNQNNILENVATRGLSKGLIGCFITQRPALTSNTLFTQSEILTYFRLSQMEWNYFKNKNIEIEDIQEKIQKAGKYNFMSHYNYKLHGPMKV